MHFKGCDLSPELIHYLVKEGDVPSVQFGTARILPGERVPAEGRSRHHRHVEISYVISGACVFHSDRRTVYLERGDVLFNPKGSEHYVENLGGEPCTIFWVLAEG